MLNQITLESFKTGEVWSFDNKEFLDFQNVCIKDH